MSEEKKINTVLVALSKRTNRVPISFAKTSDFMQSIGLTDHSKFSMMCNHLESLGYVNFVKSNGLQLTDNGYQFVKSGGFKVEEVKEVKEIKETKETPFIPKLPVPPRETVLNYIIPIGFKKAVSLIFGKKLQVTISIEGAAPSKVTIKRSII